MIRCQQDQIYAAERDVNRGMWFDKVKDAQAYVDALRETWWWPKFFWAGPSRIEVYWKRSGNASVGWYEKDKDGGAIDMLPVHRNELIILHEIAHVIAEAMNDSKAHDPFFARTYAVLVYLVLGSDTWLQLQRGFDEHGVNYMQNDPIHV